MNAPFLNKCADGSSALNEKLATQSRALIAHLNSDPQNREIIKRELAALGITPEQLDRLLDGDILPAHIAALLGETVKNN